MNAVSEEKVFPVTAQMRSAHVNREQYNKMYRASVENPEAFWSSVAKRIDWFKPFGRVREYDFVEGKIKFFEHGKLNASYNCLDRHLAAHGEKVAIIWEGNNGESQKITYRELHRSVCKFANVLKNKGVKKGDTVTIYLPMVPELPVAMLACARIGAIHSVVFGGFSPESLRNRINDCDSRLLVTADGFSRGEKNVPLKDNADKALEGTEVDKVIVIKRSGQKINLTKNDVWYHDEMERVGEICEPEEMDSEDPLFILYTSGSTGKPKGVLHTTGGYLVYVSFTHETVFDYHPGDVYWCTADCGWVTGHSYIVYGPLSNGATTMMFEGIPNYPNPGKFWELVEKHKVNIFYTAPTAIRALMREGNEWTKKHDISSLRVLGTVGEPINPEAWLWYHSNVGNGTCPIVDTWWQTETGGIMITPLPGAIALKPGSATLPFFGIEPVILDDNGNELKGASKGSLAIKTAWPGIMRGVYGDKQRFKETYFKRFPGYYFTGDGASRDEDGYYWITGRIDDVINVSGHRLGTAEIESALVSHRAVAEAAVVGFPHNLKGQGIYAYVTLKKNETKSEEMKKALVSQVRKEIGAIATPDKIQFTDALPKTRSGKIMRRLLRKIAAGETDFGDTSTLADPSVIESILKDKA